MDLPGFSLKVQDVLKEASAASNNSDLVVLFARIWFHKAVILENNSITISNELEEKFMKGLREGCRSLKNALSLKSEDQMLKLVEQVPHLVESYYEKLAQSADTDSEDLVSDILYKFWVQTMLLKVDILLSELLRDDIKILHPLKKQMGALREGLILLFKSEMNQPKPEDAEEELQALREIGELTTEAIALCNSCRADIKAEEVINEMESRLSRLLRSLQDLKDTMEGIYFQTPNSKFPQPSGSGSINALLGIFKELHCRPHHSFAFATHQMEDIRGDLEYIMCEYSHIFSTESGSSIHSQLVNHVHQVQRVIDMMQVESDPTSHQLLWLYHLSKKIKKVREEQLPQINKSAINTSVAVAPSRSSSSVLQHKELIAVFAREKKAVIDRLLGKNKRLEVVLISGMPGAGKTTLAQTVFHNPGIKLHFLVQAWCSVMQDYQKKDLWLSILSQVGIEDDMLANKDDQELLCQVSRVLSHNRYLIVMDDVWGTEAWRDLRSAFPDDENGSRILMTSRLNNVVLNPLPLNRLSDEESWKLLNMKIFGDKGFPEELREFGHKLVKNCKGLPIAIIAVANRLVDQGRDRWQQISEIDSSEIFNICQKADIFEQSYKHLRNHLKDCFCYLGVFPRDEDILVRRLLWLLIAEGFIENEEGKSLEDTAEEYLATLIDSSLVIAAKKGSNGKIKTCQVHGLVLDFCLLKATDTLNLQKVSDASDFINAELPSRLSICSDPEPFIATRAHVHGSSVGSLLLFTSNEMYPGCDNDFSLIPEKFRYLNVLDLESVNVGNTLVKGINHLPVFLKYLGVAGDMDSLPPSLSKLQRLVTLVVKGLMNKFFLPAEIWRLPSLRHIHVSNHCLFTMENEEKDGSKLDSLVSLSMPSFLCVEETKKMFMRLPNVRKLKCSLLEPRVGSKHIRQFPDFGLLEKLESLRLSYSGRPFCPGEWRLPSGLKELNLSNFRLPWDQISALIKELPNLEILKLVSRAFEGTTWEMTEEEFKNLKYLKLDSLNIVHWKADDDQLPNLEQLVLRNCEQLQDVPSRFGGADTMKKIEVHRCSKAVEVAVELFVEDQRDFGNNELITNIS